MIKKFESMKDKQLIITAINADIQVKTIYNLLRAGQSIASVYYIYITCICIHTILTSISDW